MYAARQEIILQYRLAQEVIALLGAVAAEALDRRHLIGGAVQSLNHRRTERLCHVADTKRDDIRILMCSLKGVYLLRYVGKQIVARQLQEMFVY